MAIGFALNLIRNLGPPGGDPLYDFRGHDMTVRDLLTEDTSSTPIMGHEHNVRHHNGRDTVVWWEQG